MRQLPRPTSKTAESDLKAGVYSYKYGGKTLGYDIKSAEVETIIERYKAYDASGGEPNDCYKGLDLNQALVESVKKAFKLTLADRKLKHLRDAVMSEVHTCPICDVEPVRHLDHYLPESIYKLLAIYDRNLIPMCAACNEKKKANVTGPGGHRFIHPYFDQLPTTPYLLALVAIDNGGLRCSIQVNPDAELPNALASRIHDQFEALELNKRYKREINIYVGTHAFNLHGLYPNNGHDGVAQYLSLHAKYEAERFHANDWRAIVLQALSQDEEFCEGGFSTVFPLPEHVAPLAR